MRFLLGIVVAICSAQVPLAATADSPNVVLIVADYMGASDIGPYGATDVSTPSLDDLAVQGARFTNYYAAAPICGPSRAAMLTGKYPARIGFEDNISRGSGLSASEPTLPALLKARGYRNGYFGKWHLGRSEEMDPLAHGFDEFLGFHDWTVNYYTHRNADGEEALVHNRTVAERDGYLTDLLTDESIRFIEQSRSEPFFVYVAYNAALPPYLGPDLPAEHWDVDFGVAAATRKDYVSMVEAMDAAIGRLLDTLDDLNLTDNTLVVFTYDHNGRHLVRNAPFSGGFATLNEGGIRVPLIMRWPGRLQADTVLRRPAIGMDVTATILGAGGIATESLDLDGRDLLRPAGGPRTFFWRMLLGDFGQAAARRDKWKLLVHRFAPFDSPTVYLYDVEADPGESKDLYHQHQNLADQMYRELLEWEGAIARSRGR